MCIEKRHILLGIFFRNINLTNILFIIMPSRLNKSKFKKMLFQISVILLAFDS